MSEESTSGVSPESGETPESRIESAWHKVVEAFAAVGTILIGVLMIIICADIVARNSLGASLPLVSEGGALLLVALVALQLGATVRAGRLARTEVIITPLMDSFPRTAAFVSSIFNLVGAAVIGTIAWSTLRIVEKDYAASEFIGVPGIATLPTWPFRVLILLGFAVAAIEFMFRAAAALRATFGARS